jgi:hypothetical protein
MVLADKQALRIEGEPAWPRSKGGDEHIAALVIDFAPWVMPVQCAASVMQVMQSVACAPENGFNMPEATGYSQQCRSGRRNEFS